MEVPTTTTVWTADPASCIPPYSGRGQPPLRPRRDAVRSVAGLAAELPADAWRRLQVREGAVGPLVFEFAAVRAWAVRHRRPGPPIWVLIRRSLEAEPEVKYHVSNGNAGTPLGVLAQVACTRQRVEDFHEEMLHNALESRPEFKYWLIFGGEQTLRSYSSAVRPGLEVIPAEHLRFIRENCRDYHEIGNFIFVHASYDPDLPMDRQTERSLRWESANPDQMRPQVSGKMIIAGHTQQKGGEILDFGYFKILDTAAYGGGWLTTLEVVSGELIQANQRGEVRSIKPVHPEAQAEFSDGQVADSGPLDQFGL